MTHGDNLAHSHASHDATPNIAAEHEAAPLLEAMAAYANRDTAAFHTPGHRHGMGSPDELVELLGSQALRSDLTTLPETDSLNNPSGVIQEAERLAALAWGAERTFFLANGSTLGNQAAMLAACGPNERIIVPRSVHRSTLGGMILAGADPIFVAPPWDERLGIAHPLTPAMIAETLLQNSDAKAVVLVSPTYHGVAADTSTIQSICARRDIPLIVDEAWGAHLRFHPELPLSALEAGADMVVQSTHKTLSAMTQASLLHVQGRMGGFRRDTLGLLQSTSPNFLLLASLDAARRQMALHGHELLTRALMYARDARSALNDIDGIDVLGYEQIAEYGTFDLDETRVVFDVSNLGLTGYQVRDMLNNRFDVQPEMAGLREVVLLITVGTIESDITRLIGAMAQIAAAAPRRRHPAPPIENPIGNDFVEVMTPREAFFAPAECIEFSQSIGHTCVEIVAPYPPGIPLLVPGECVTPAVHEILRLHLENGSVFNGPDDSSLQTIRVVK